MSIYRAVYSRHGSQYFEECNTLDEAISFLSTGAEFGKCFQICIVAPDGKILTEESPTFNIADQIPQILQKLLIPFGSERGTFTLFEV